jgi:hypothetical protein
MDEKRPCHQKVVIRPAEESKMNLDLVNQEETYMRKHTQIILAVLMLLLVAVESQSQEAAKGVVAKTTERHFLMWKASSQTASVYLAGSLHLAPLK